MWETHDSSPDGPIASGTGVESARAEGAKDDAPLYSTTVFQDVMVAHMKALCLLPSTYMDEWSVRSDGPEISKNHPSLQAFFLSTNPFAVALNFWFMRRVVLPLIVLLSWMMCVGNAVLIMKMQFPAGDYSYFRFTNLQTRGGLPPLTPGVKEFGILFQEFGGLSALCSQTAETIHKTNSPHMLTHTLQRTYLPGAEEEPAASWTISVSNKGNGTDYASVPFKTGWYFVTSDAKPEDDPVRFKVEGSHNLVEWTVIGSSGAWSKDSEFMFPTSIFKTPKRRGEYVFFSGIATWATYGGFCIWALFTLCFTCILIMAELNRRRYASRAISMCFSLMGTVSILTGIQRGYWGHQGELAYFACVGINFLLVSLGFHYFQAYFDLVVSGAVLILLIFQILVFTTFKNSPNGLSGFSNLSVFILFSFIGLTSIFTIAVRFVWVLRVRVLMQSDRAIYASIWENVKAEKLEPIKQLDAFVKHLSKVAANHECRQFKRVRFGSKMKETNEHIHHVLSNQDVCEEGDLAVPGLAPADMTDEHNAPTDRKGPDQREPTRQLTWIAADAADSSPPHDAAVHAPLINTLHPIASQSHIQNLLFNQSGNSLHDIAANEAAAVPSRPQQCSPCGDEEDRRPIRATPLSWWKARGMVVRSQQRRFSFPSNEQLSIKKLKATDIDRNLPCKSLDQLFAQACHMEEILVIKVLDISAKCNAKLKRKGKKDSARETSPAAAAEAQTSKRNRPGLSETSAQTSHVRAEWGQANLPDQAKDLEAASPCAGNSLPLSLPSPCAGNSNSMTPTSLLLIYRTGLPQSVSDAHGNSTNSPLMTGISQGRSHSALGLHDHVITISNEQRKHTSQMQEKGSSWPAWQNSSGQTFVSVRSQLARLGALIGMCPPSNALNTVTAPERAPSAFVRWGTGTVDRSELDLQSIKSAFRCLEEVYSTRYMNDPSYLTDICRQTLYFESVEDLHSCLKMLQNDPTVHIVHVKSNLTPDADSPTGFRFVKVNLRIVTELTAYLCVETHVCELLLVLQDFAKAQTPEMHALYLTWRMSESSWAAKLLTWFSTWWRYCSRCSKGDVRRMSSRVHPATSVLLPMDTGSNTPQQQNADGDSDSPRSTAISPKCALRQGKMPSPFVGVFAAGHGASLAGSTGSRVSDSVTEESPTESQSHADWSTLSSAHAAKHVAWRHIERQGEMRRSLSDVLGPSTSPSALQELFSDGSAEAPIRRSVQREEAPVSRTTTCGLKISDELAATLEAHCRLACLGYASVLDKNWRHHFSLGLQEASARSILFSSRPLTVGSTKRSFQMLLLATAVFYFWFVVSEIQILMSRDARAYKHYRFTNIRSLGETEEATAPGILSFGLLLPDGCAPFHSIMPPEIQRAARIGTAAAGPRMYVSYDEPVKMRGWYFEVDGTVPGTQIFEIEGTNDDLNMTGGAEVGEASWDLVGGPVIRLSNKDKRRIVTRQLEHSRLPFRYYRPKVDQLSIYAYDLTTMFPEFVFRVIRPFVEGIGLCLYVFFGALKRQVWAGYSIVWVFSFSLFIGAVALELMFQVGCYALGVESAFLLVYYVFFVLGLVFQRHLMSMLVIAGVWAIFQQMVVNAMFGCPVFESFAYQQFAGTLGFAVATYLGRWSVKRQCRNIVAADKKRYDTLWLEEVDKDAGSECLLHLEKVVAMLGILPTDPCFQNSRSVGVRLKGRKKRMSQKLAPNHMLELMGEDGKPIQLTIDKESRVCSLDQLYAQASICIILLKQKVKVWADKSNGYFPLKQRSAEGKYFMSWRDAQNLPASEGLDLIKWPSLKKHRRAIEKVLRVYGIDVSSLVDIARHKILFESLSDLTCCLGTIATDENISIIRIKNRLSKKYDSSLTAGYRDVAINFCIRSSKSIAMGAETHVCELQLQLLSFGELQRQVGHVHYVEHRNLNAD